MSWKHYALAAAAFGGAIALVWNLPGHNPVAGTKHGAIAEPRDKWSLGGHPLPDPDFSDGTSRPMKLRNALGLVPLAAALAGYIIGQNLQKRRTSA
jgi:hypothetical protein